jgi:hypothetical protein
MLCKHHLYKSANSTTVEFSHASLGANDTVNMCKGPVILQEEMLF